MPAFLPEGLWFAGSGPVRPAIRGPAGERTAAQDAFDGEYAYQTIRNARLSAAQGAPGSAPDLSPGDEEKHSPAWTNAPTMRIA